MNKAKMIPILIVGIAIGIAFAIALLVYYKMQNKPIIVKEERGDTLKIAVAKTDLPLAISIEKSMIKMVPYLKKNLPPGCFSDRTALKGRILIYPIKLNEPIFESRLAPTTVASGGMAVVLSPNKRAMSVSVNKVIGISGFIRPNNRVDVLVTTKYKAGSSGPISITKTVLENILVLAVGQGLAGADKEKKGQSKSMTGVITLEVTPEEGEKLALATNKGSIQLALRNYNDTAEVITPGSTIKTLLASYRDSNRLKVAKATNATSKPAITQSLYTVTVIKGTTVKDVTF
jgi:pilus assembly protein CpaB